MMMLSIVATVILLGVLFYHRVNLLVSSLILLAWTAALGVSGCWFPSRLSLCRSTLYRCVNR